jgi:hypothetical protein
VEGSRRNAVRDAEQKEKAKPNHEERPRGAAKRELKESSPENDNFKRSNT